MPATVDRRRTVLHPAAWWAGVLLAVGLALRPAAAQDFEVRTANLRLADAGWVLTARIDYRLTDDAVRALESGIPLTFSVETAVSRQRRWWLDPEVLDVRRDWQLSYDPLTKRYLVKHPEGRDATSHGTLFGALNALGRVQGILIADAAALDPGKRYDVAVRAVLDQQRLPGPLQVIAFWDDGFSLESDWYEWTMGP
jgi:hypothetical protein